MNNPFRLYDFPITFDPIQDDMTEEERRTLLITIIEELSNSGAGDALGSLGGANNASTKKLSEQVARLIEEHQRRHASNTAKIINDWLSIKYKWQNKLGPGASGGHVESVAAKQVMQSIDDLKHIDPHQSYVSTKRALNDVIRVSKFAGHVGTVINASIALYSGDSNKVMKTITSIFAGILGAIVAGAAATAAIGGAIAGSAVAAFVAVAVIAATASYFSGKAAEWAWDNGLGDLVNDFFDKVGLKDDIEEFFDGIGDYLKDLVDKASKAISDLWDRAKNWLRRSDPLVLDLDGDGIELVAADGAVLFDHDGNRVAEATGWVAPDDGFLVIDKNGNGRIDDGSELFGDGNPDAFHDPEVQNTLSAGIRALRRYDSNQDGVFDAADTAFGQVRVWRDLNQDGVSQANELFTLADVGIQSIHLNPVSTADADVGHGNVADSTGQFTRTDGSQGNFYDMLLASSPFYRQFKDEVELTETARSLLDIRGSGAVRDLREAASLDEDLAAMVAGIAPGISRGEMLAQVDAILQRWADTSGMQDTEIWLRETQGLNGSFRVVSGGADRTDLTMMLSVLERFNGSRFFAEQANGRLWASGVTFSPVISQLSGETVRSFDITLPEENAVFLQQSYAALKNAVYGRLVRDARLSDYIDDFEIGFGHDGLQIGIDKALVRLQNRYSTEPGKALEDAVDLLRHASGMMGASTLQLLQQVEAWVQQLSATEIGRALLINSGFSTVNAGEQFNLNKMQGISLGEDGQDRITGHAGMDVIFSGSGIDNVNSGDGNDIVSGGAGGDSLSGGNGNDLLLGGQDNDYLYGDDGNDTLYGGVGQDRLEGGTGNDRLDGGTGNDILEGEHGNDSYLFGRGDGMDVIIEEDGTVGNQDTLIFKSGISVSDVKVTRSWDGLILKIKDSSDEIRIENYFLNDGANNWQVEEIRFVDAPDIVWRLDDIKAKALLGNADNDTITGYSSADTLEGGDGDDRLYGVDGNDALYGNEGSDRLDAGTGNDLLDGGTGTDYLYGGMGNDTYMFGRGDGIDTIYDEDATTNNFDVLVFKSGVTVDDVQVTRNGSMLVLKIKGASDQIRIERYFEDDGETPNWQVEEIRFVDAPDIVWRLDDIKAKALIGSTENDTITGYASADTLVGGGGHDTLYGLDGDDALHGNADDDVLYGGNGNDRLLGGDGADYLHGGDGNNLLQGGTGNDSLYAANGNDTLEGGEGQDRLESGAGDDLLLGGQGNDYLFAGSGDDILDSGEGSDGMYGEEGNDTYLFGRGDGADTINDGDMTAGNIDTLLFKTGVTADDVQVRRSGSSLVLKIKNSTDQIRVEGYFENDGESQWLIEEIRFADAPDIVWRLDDIKAKALMGSTDNDYIWGYAAADMAAGSDGHDTLYGLGGDDVLHGDAGSDTLYGGSGNDRLQGGQNDDYLYGEDGDDILMGDEGNDRLQGGAGSDTLYAGDGYDWLIGGLGDDYLHGEKGGDSLSGGTGNDYLYGGEGIDYLRGEDGDDRLDGGTGDDHLHGGNGNDTYLFGRGDGMDTIYESATSGDGLDALVFKSSITMDDVQIIRDGNNLVLTIKETTDSICLYEYFEDGIANSHRIEEIRFASSPETVWRLADINEKLLEGTAGAMSPSRQTSENIRLTNTMRGEVPNALLPNVAANSAELQHTGTHRRWRDFIINLPGNVDTLHPSLPPFEIGGGTHGASKWPIYMPGYPSDWDKDDSTFTGAALADQNGILLPGEVPVALSEMQPIHVPAGLNSSELQSLIEAMATYDTGSAMTSRDLLTEPVLQDMSSRHFQADMSRNNLQAG